MYYILVDKITYVKSFDYTDNKVRFAGDKKYAKKFDMIELKTNFIQIRDSLLERGIKNVCILSECENDELGEVGLNKEFKTYKFYLEYKNGTSSNEKTTVKKKEKKEVSKSEEEIKMLTPKTIAKEISKVVIGQEEAIKKFSISAYNHLLMINNPDEGFHKQNILLCGASGTGKTLIAETASKIIGVPCVVYNIATTTASGYYGDSVSDVFSALLNEADGDLELAQKGIVVLDEFDKKVLRKENGVNGRIDVGGEAIVHELLKMLEGTKVKITKGGAYGREITFDTTNVTFVLAGALTGIEELLEKQELEKLNKGNRMGFMGQSKTNEVIDKKALRRDLTKEDLKKYGFSDELLGRISIIAKLNTLGKEEMIEILNNENGYMHEIERKFELLGKKIIFSDKFKEDIAEKALSNENLGARELNSLLNEALEDIMFSMPDEDKEVYEV